MPHQCTSCAHVFPDGSKRMLAGCPECGGKKFQFLPPGTLPDGIEGGQDPPTAPDARSVDRQTAEDDAIIEAPTEPASAESLPAEDHAQAAARRAFASADELPPAPAPAQGAEEHAGKPAPERPPEGPATPDLADLRAELNAQFESIKILEPGQYELNLMGLYDREEYIIALEEDGRYVIDVASASDRRR